MPSVFDAVDAYEIAFSYRDVGAEVDRLSAWCARHGVGAPRAVLELAAGPAAHAVEFARRGSAGTALDLSNAMCARAAERAAQAGANLRVVQADMTDFELDLRFDLALLLLDSASLLRDDEAMAGFLGATGRHLRPGGLLVVDLSAEPSDGDRPDWTIEAGDLSVRTQWGSTADVKDPVTGVEAVHVRMTAWRRGDPHPEVVVDEILPSRAWTAAQITQIAEPALELVARYVALDRDLPPEGAPRDILLLRRPTPFARRSRSCSREWITDHENNS
jgi:SAM-dependent methyltransferase